MKFQRIYNEGTIVDFEYKNIIKKGEIIRKSEAGGLCRFDFYIVKPKEEEMAYVVGGYMFKKIY